MIMYISIFIMSLDPFTKKLRASVEPDIGLIPNCIGDVLVVCISYLFDLHDPCPLCDTVFSSTVFLEIIFSYYIRPTFQKCYYSFFKCISYWQSSISRYFL